LHSGLHNPRAGLKPIHVRRLRGKERGILQRRGVLLVDRVGDSTGSSGSAILPVPPAHPDSSRRPIAPGSMIHSDLLDPISILFVIAIAASSSRAAVASATGEASNASSAAGNVRIAIQHDEEIQVVLLDDQLHISAVAATPTVSPVPAIAAVSASATVARRGTSGGASAVRSACAVPACSADATFAARAASGAELERGVARQRKRCRLAAALLRHLALEDAVDLSDGFEAADDVLTLGKRGSLSSSRPS